MWYGGRALVAVAATAAATAAAATEPTAAAAAATAAAAVTTAAAATTTATEPTAATTAAAATRALFARAGFVDGQGATVVLLAVECRDGGRRLVIVRHLDEAEPLAAAGVAVVDDLCRDDLAVGAEQLFEFRAIDFVAQV